MFMLDSDQEPSYNLSKNLLILPRILKLIVDMVNDSTPLYISKALHICMYNTADFIWKVLGVYTRSMEPIYLSLWAQVSVISWLLRILRCVHTKCGYDLMVCQYICADMAHKYVDRVYGSLDIIYIIYNIINIIYNI